MEHRLLRASVPCLVLLAACWTPGVALPTCLESCLEVRFHRICSTDAIRETTIALGSGVQTVDGRVAMDLTAGVLEARCSSGFIDGNASVIANDEFTILGRPTGTAISIRLELRVVATGRGGWVPSASLTRGIQVAATPPYDFGQVERLDTVLVLPFIQSAGMPFVVSSKVLVQTGEGGGGVVGTYRFRGLPSGTRVVSCGGYDSDLVADPYPPTLDANRLSVSVTKLGTFAHDNLTNSPGLEFPAGSGKYVVFASGISLGAVVDGGIRVSRCDPYSEFGPGPIENGAPQDADLPANKVYRLNRVYPTPALRDALLMDYRTGAVPRGAPEVQVLSSGELDILGDGMTWNVYNDADPSRHQYPGFGTAPLGIEIQQKAFAFTLTEALRNTVFLHFRLLNKGPHVLRDTYVGVWADADIGHPRSDLVGCDTLASLGYTYNGSANDNVYGSTPPAVGYDLLQGPRADGDGRRVPMTSFTSYGFQPLSSGVYNMLKGFDIGGNERIDPTTGQPTTYSNSGDPVTGQGWIDSGPGDRRMLLGSGPFTFVPGDTQDVYLAIVVGDGADWLSSITRMREFDAAAQQFFDSGFDETTPVQMSFVDARTAPGRVVLRWFAADGSGLAARVYRKEADREWSFMLMIAADGTGYLVFEDPTVVPGRRYGYRLGVSHDGGEEFAGETWVDIPAALSLSVAAAPPNPGGDLLRINIALPTADPARLDVIGIDGRVMHTQTLVSVGVGAHTIDLEAAPALPAGVYLLRLTQAGRSAIAKATVIR